MKSIENTSSLILYEDDDLLVLNKPTDVPSVPHSERPEDADHMVAIAIQLCKELDSAWPDDIEKGLLHRLDRGTSGVLVFAKNKKTFDELKKNWKKDSITKTYRALCTESEDASTSPIKKLNQLPYICSIQIGHDLKSKKKMRAILRDVDLKRIRSNPREAITLVKKIIALQGRSLFDIEVDIQTGVMHQIRVHLKSLGYPILGDPLYSEVSDSRLWLHAWKIQIQRDSGRSMSIEAPLPQGWVV